MDHLVCRVLLATCVVTATSVTTPPPPPPPSSSSCLLVEEGGGGDYTRLWDKGVHCAETGVTHDATKHLRKALTIADFRLFFADYCRREAGASSQVRRCLAAQLALYRTCGGGDNGQRARLFAMYRSGMVTVLEGGCAEGGEKLATLFHGITRMMVNGTVDKAGVIKCARTTMFVFESVESNEAADVASVMNLLYRELSTFRECVKNVDLLEADLGAVADWFLGEIIRTAKCVDPSSGELVACEDVVVASLRAPTLCDVVADRTETSSDVYDALESDVFDWYHDDDAVRNYDVGEEDDDAPRHRYSLYCRLKSLPSTFDARYDYLADACLRDATRRRAFNATTVSLRRALASACGDDEGGRVAEVVRVVERRGGDTLKRCARVAKATRRQPPTSSRLYREALIFKQCLLDALSDDRRSLDAARTLMKDILGELLCIHPEDGTMVRCETLATGAA